jgi:hypothetical protein
MNINDTISPGTATEETRMNSDEMALAADRLSDRLRDITAGIRERARGDEYRIYTGEIADLEGIANALRELAEDRE